MLRLTSMMYAIVGTTMAGIFMVASLTMGYDTLNPLLIAAALGAVAGLPVSYFVAKAIKNL